MAASRIGLAAGRMCRRYQIFFYVAIVLVCVQLFLAYNFYSLQTEELRKLDEWKSRVEQLEKMHTSESLVAVKNSHRSHSSILPEQGSRVDHGEEVQNGAGNGKESQSKDQDKFPIINNNVNQKKVPQKKVPKGHNKSPKHPVVQAHSSSKNVSTWIPDMFYEGGRKLIRCTVKAQEARSAVDRAETEQCKAEIIDVACRHQLGELYTHTHLPNTCPVRGDKASLTYLGCFKDNLKERILSTYHTELPATNTPQACVFHCMRAGFALAAMQFGVECWCGAAYTVPKPAKLEDARCDMPCSGDKGMKCGGFLAAAMYSTGIHKRVESAAPFILPSDLAQDVKKVQIVFVLTLNGRALRQVKRLLKSIYSTHHYYFIHVDSRQEYLYRELREIASQYPNIRMATRRFATIWGGANLITMLMECMRELLTFHDWTWDFFLNLSESDFPIKPLEQLEAYLSANSDKNFVKSHGKDTPRFIRKQGLDQIFYQCDNHMWRLGKRTLPDGIRIDGGSDWIVLNKNFCRYVTNSQEPLVKGLIEYWHHSLLPAESFFHTILQNSKHCITFVNNNLHVVNWRRKQGCKCQYKHVVDWCGCSPNDFFPEDMGRIRSMEKKPTYFGRKFEAIINLEVINLLDAYLYGAYSRDVLGLQSYWQSEYDYRDIVTKVDNTFLSYFHTFARLGAWYLSHSAGSAECDISPTNISYVHHFREAESYQGVLVHTNVTTKLGVKFSMETQIRPQRKYQMFTLRGPTSRLQDMQVSTGFDPKEEVFRNFATLLGPHSDLTLAVTWGDGPSITITLIFVDPSEAVAASYETQVAEGEHVKTFKPEFNTPLRPGVWTVKLVFANQVIAEHLFLILPFTHYGGRAIKPDEARRLHSGPEGGTYTSQDFSNVRNNAYMQKSEESLNAAKNNAVQNSLKTEQSLIEWADNLMGRFWTVSEVCVSGRPPRACSVVPLCRATRWSSQSPDPKSELGKIDEATGRFRR